MANITVKALGDAFIGKKVNPEKFDQIFRKNSYMYIAYCSNFEGKFGITERLYRIWKYSEIDFRVCVELADGVITGTTVSKYVDGCGGHGRPIVHTRKPSQQEYRVARRVLEYVTN